MINIWTKNILSIKCNSQDKQQILKQLGKLSFGLTKYPGEPYVLEDLQNIGSKNSQTEAVKNISDVDTDMIVIEDSIHSMAVDQTEEILLQIHTLYIEPRSVLLQLSKLFPLIFIQNSFSSYDVDGILEICDGKTKLTVSGVNKDNFKKLKDRLGVDLNDFRQFYLEILLLRSINAGHKLHLDDYDKNNPNLRYHIISLTRKQPEQFNQKFIRLLETGMFL